MKFPRAAGEHYNDDGAATTQSSSAVMPKREHVCAACSPRSMRAILAIEQTVSVLAIVT